MLHDFTRAELIVAGTLLLAITAGWAAAWLATITAVSGPL